MKKRLIAITVLVLVSALLLTACNRPRLRQGTTGASEPTAQTEGSDILKYTQAPTNQVKPTSTVEPSLQSTSAPSDTSAVSTDLNELSNLFDTLNSDLNSTDTLSDFK